MKIQGSTEANAGKTLLQSKGQQDQDGQLKAIQGQIDNVQKQLKNLANDKEVTAEEKMKKRKDLQEELQSLNNQMMQRKIEIQKEKREAAAEAQRQQAEEASAKSPDGKVDNAQGVMSSKTVEGLVAASTTVKRVDATHKIKTKLEGTNRVLESEIAIDQSRGVDTSKKQEEVDKNKDLIQNIMEDLGEKIGEASKAIENVMAADKVDKKEIEEQVQKDAQTEKADEKLRSDKPVKSFEKGQYVDEYL